MPRLLAMGKVHSTPFSPRQAAAPVAKITKSQGKSPADVCTIWPPPDLGCTAVTACSGKAPTPPRHMRQKRLRHKLSLRRPLLAGEQRTRRTIAQIGLKRRDLIAINGAARRSPALSNWQIAPQNLVPRLPTTACLASRHGPVNLTSVPKLRKVSTAALRRSK